MKSHTFLSLCLSLSPLALAIWPVPSKSNLGNSTLWIGRNVDVQLSIAQTNVGLMYIQNQLHQQIVLK
jgi:hypothetical protein